MNECKPFVNVLKSPAFTKTCGYIYGNYTNYIQNMTKSLLYDSGDLFLREKYKKFLKTLIWGSYDSVYINYWSILHLISGIATYTCCITYIT